MEKRWDSGALGWEDCRIGLLSTLIAVIDQEFTYTKEKSTQRVDVSFCVNFGTAIDLTLFVKSI